MKKPKPIHFKDKHGKTVLTVPGTMTIKEWVRRGLPKINLVDKNKPMKEGEARA
jgi:hypothetical protein